MTAYAPSDVRAIRLGNGCGEQHLANDGERLSTDCLVCAPLLIANKSLGWAANPADVALTCDERRAVEADEAQAKRAQALAMQVFGAQLATLTKTGVLTDPAAPAAPAPAAAPKLEDLSDEDLAAMEAAVAAAKAARNPVADATGEAAEPKRRGPGRPRKVS